MGGCAFVRPTSLLFDSCQRHRCASSDSRPMKNCACSCFFFRHTLSTSTACLTRIFSSDMLPRSLHHPSSQRALLYRSPIRSANLFGYASASSHPLSVTTLSDDHSALQHVTNESMTPHPYPRRRWPPSQNAPTRFLATRPSYPSRPE